MKNGAQLKINRIVSIVLAILLYFISQISCDLPIQCVKHQIVGQWRIEISKGYVNTNGFIKCGHGLPDKPSMSYKAFMNTFKPSREVLVDLHESGEVILVKNSQSYKGSWTMMYDEGLSIDANNTNYFAFFKYYPVKEEEVSEDILVNDISVTSRSKVTTYEFDCTETIVGWYTEYNKNVKGCIKAYKQDPQEENRHLRSESKGNVIQPIDIDINNFTFQDDNKNDNEDEMIQNQSASSIAKKRRAYLQSTLNGIMDDLHPDQNSPKNESENQDKQMIEFQNQSSSQKKITKDIQKNTLIDNQNMHQSRVEELNTLNNKWQAGISSSFKDLSLNEVNKKAGRTKRKSHQKKKSKNSTQSEADNLRQKKEDEQLYMHFSINDVSDLPKSFTWEEYIDKPIEQNDCGSCYIISTVQMLNARLKIKYGKDFNEKISMQHLLDCSFFSQGCEGGYPFELGRFGKDYFLVPERDSKFLNAAKKCDLNKFNQLEDYFKITEYGFVGKQYGRVNEREMMMEIMNNGPIVANFKTSADFVYYQSGVYHTVSAADWILKCERQPEWRPVEHAVMCYGWGESEEDGKYWLMQNSWGEDWGEKGRFKIRRGTDESFVESSAEYAQVEYIKRDS